MAKYAAFPRGINVGGRTVKMDALREALETAGYENVKTLQAAGNVVFEARESDPPALRAKVEKTIKDKFGFNVHVIIRSAAEIRKLIRSAPFKGIKVKPQTRLYVTFRSEGTKSKLKLPYRALKGDYTILWVSKSEIISALTLTPKVGTVDAMAILEKEFGKEITTRNWNTILKLRPLLAET